VSTTVRATIAYTRWTRTTNSGNPVFKLHTENGSFITEPDAQVNYHVSDATKGEHILTLNERGRVIGAVKADG
jgi:hypothetical protein